MDKENYKIFFIVNTLGLTGGIKVIFEQANRLSGKGYNVNIIHLLKLKKGLAGSIISVLKKIKYLAGINLRPQWFDLEININIYHNIKLDSIKFSENDIIIATANETADYVNQIKTKNKNLFYFIQDYENWTRDSELVDNTYLFPLKKITISSWLSNLLKEKFNEGCYGPVPNGIDFQKFAYYGEKTVSDEIKILIMYHPIAKKGFNEGYKALSAIKNIFPNIEIISFGAYNLPNKYPLIDKYCYKPSADELKKIYHEANIFLCPSFQEGFTLTPMEAMAAQCAIVSTEVGGPIDYCVDQENALLVPAGRVDLMIKSITELIENPDKMLLIAKNGQRAIKNFSWEKSNDLFEKILLENIV